MKIIKLSAIDSTNSFLKELAQNSVIENYTTVIAENQVSGRGQMGNRWHSKNGKNLLFSTFIKFNKLAVLQQNYISFATSLAIFEALNDYAVPKLGIKWPNDILSADKKICGILIENVIQNQRLSSSVIGIGINVNQEDFPAELPNASSIKKITGKEINLDILAKAILEKLRISMELVAQKCFDILEEKYLAVLYKKDHLTVFKDKNERLFNGIIRGVSCYGKLQVQLEDGSIEEFGIKEVSYR